MTLLTVLLAAAFVTVSAEFRTTNGSYSASRALNIAQAGLQRYFAEAHGLTAGYDSTQYAIGGGFARVVARKLRDSTTTERSLWVVYATGFDTSNTTNRGGMGAQRVVARLARHDQGVLPARAAMTAVNAVRMMASGGNPIDGTDFGFVTPNCPVARRGDTTGLTVASGSYSNEMAGTLPIRGIEYLATDLAVFDSTRIDWAKLVAGQFTPDYVNELPPAGNATYYTYYFPDPTGVVQIPAGSRRGFLVTQGDVRLLSGAHWDGIILAGGMLDGNGSFSFVVHGMVITGLNIALGRSVSANLLRRNPGGTLSRIIRWDYCYATSSISSLGFLTPVPGSSTDSWATY